MTTLLVDAGNSRLKWAICEQGRFLQQGTFVYQWPTLEEQFTHQWGPLTAVARLDRVVLSSVAAERLSPLLHQWLLDHWVQEGEALTIEHVVAQAESHGVRCAYVAPAQLGADRWAALVAARAYFDGTSCVIDCGTALTIDVLAEDGCHVGGLIAPGLEMMRHSLTANTEKVRADAPVAGYSMFDVRDTSGAVQAGIMAATVGAVQQALEQCYFEWRHLPRCVVTGGDAEAVIAATSGLSVGGTSPSMRHEVDWVLKGLAIIAGCCE